MGPCRPGACREPSARASDLSPEEHSILTQQLYHSIFPSSPSPKSQDWKAAWDLHNNQSEAFRRLASCAVEHFSSAAGQDRVLWPTLMAITTGRAGTFVEIGANDGITGSNTLVFERCLGWSGVLIEANPANFHKLVAAGRNRSRAVHAAVCAADDPYGYVNITERGDYLSGDVMQLSQYSVSKFPWLTKRGASMVQVPCKPLSKVLHLNNFSKRVDFLSLDVEGSEERVLQTINPARFNVVLVELDHHNAVKDQRVRELLYKAGMIRATALPKLWTDEIWVHSSVQELVAPYVCKHHVGPHQRSVCNLSAALGHSWQNMY